MTPDDSFKMPSLAEIDRELGINHRDGVPWHEAPLPRRFHRCEPWTTGIRMGVLRCACGAIASTFGPWTEKNSRRGPWWKRRP